MTDDLAFLQELLDTPETPTAGQYTQTPQNGPLRYFDREMRCASRGCGSSTHYKLQSIPYCSTHTIKLMNEMLIKHGVEK